MVALSVRKTGCVHCGRYIAVKASSIRYTGSDLKAAREILFMINAGMDAPRRPGMRKAGTLKAHHGSIDSFLHDHASFTLSEFSAYLGRDEESTLRAAERLLEEGTVYRDRKGVFVRVRVR